MTQFTCKGVKQINNRISFKHLYHSYLSVFFISVGVPNGKFPEILIAKCRSRFYCTLFFCWGRSCWRKRCVREINVSRAWNPVHAGDKALTRETPAKRGRVNRYGFCILPPITVSWLKSRELIFCSEIGHNKVLMHEQFKMVEWQLYWCFGIIHL